MQPQSTTRSFRLTPFDSSGAFFRDADSSQVLRLAVRGAGSTMLGQAAGMAVRFATVVVLARLLTPADFGLVTMVTSFSLLLVNLGANGFTEAIIQRDRIDSVLASNLFWINVGGGVLLTIGFAAAGPLLARFYDNPLVAPLAVGVSLTILFTSFQVMHLALVARAMRFSQVSGNSLVAQIVLLTVSLFLAWLGWGYWALIAGAVAERLSLAVGAWTLCRWVPGRPRRVPETASMVRFAIYVYGRFCLDYFRRNMDNLLIGWRFDAQSLGFYKKAYDLFALSAVLDSLTNVAVSALRRLRSTPLEYRRHLLRALSVITFVGMPAGAILTLVGSDLIRLLLGPGWEPAGRIFTFFGPGVAAMFLYGTHGWIHLSIGTPDRWIRWGVIEFITTALLFMVALRWGAEGIATAWSLALWILTLPALWYAGKPIDIGPGAVIAVVWKHVLAALLAGGATAFVVAGFRSLGLPTDLLGVISRIATTSISFIALYLTIEVALYRGLTPIRQVIELCRELIPGLRLSKPSLAVPEIAAVIPAADKR